MNWPGQRKARNERDRQMRLAREAVDAFDRTLDPIYKEIARIHCLTARAFNRNAWRGIKR